MKMVMIVYSQAADYLKENHPRAGVRAFMLPMEENV